MFQTEKHLRQWLMKYIPGHWQPIELSQGVGIPDLNYCVDGREGWAELKVLPYLKNLSSVTLISVGLRSSQYSWMIRRARAGGNVRLILAVQPSSLLIIKDTTNMHLMLQGSKITWDSLVGCSQDEQLIEVTRDSIYQIIKAL